MAVFRIDSLDPYTNLAIEESLLVRAQELGPSLVLWRNSACVVIGRHQNPWVECDLARMRTDNVPLVRRISGGGAVFHDPGNTNYTFFAPSDRYDEDRHFRIVLAALASVGIHAERNERNDLLADGRKFSGSAYRHTKGVSLHHGTLLVRADLDRLGAYLAGSGARIESKATASVRSQVINLSELAPDLEHDALCRALAAAFADEMRAEDPPASESAERPTSAASPVSPAAALAEHIVASDAAMTRRARELASWEWLYGHTPRFAVNVVRPDGLLRVTVRRGVIEEVAGDAAGPRLRDTLIGTRYDDRRIAEVP